jgi:hypothetical protein
MSVHVSIDVHRKRSEGRQAALARCPSGWYYSPGL